MWIHEAIRTASFHFLWEAAGFQLEFVENHPIFVCLTRHDLHIAITQVLDGRCQPFLSSDELLRALMQKTLGGAHQFGK